MKTSREEAYAHLLEAAAKALEQTARITPASGEAAESIRNTVEAIKAASSEEEIHLILYGE